MELFKKNFLYFRRENPLWKKFLYFREWNFLAPKILIKLFYAVHKNLHPWPTTIFFYLLKHPVFLFIFSDLLDTMPHQRWPLSSHFFVTYGTPCHTRGHHFHILPNLYLGKQRISLWVLSILRICLCPYS